MLNMFNKDNEAVIIYNKDNVLLCKYFSLDTASDHMEG